MSLMAYNAAAGLGGMLKAGSRHLQDDDAHSASVVQRNITACLQLTQMLSSSFGPQGRNKLVQNHLEKLIVTSDCACILNEIDVEHPTAQLLAQAAQKQQTEAGDASNLCLTLAGELLWQTSLLIQKMTWQPAPEILAGYQHAFQIVQDLLPTLVCETLTDLSDTEQLLKVLKPVLASKQYGSEDILAPLVAQACQGVMQGGSLNVQAVRCCKILGAGVRQSRLLHGYVAQRRVETVTNSAQNCKIAVYACGLEASSTEAKGTVVMKSAQDLKDYNISEEVHLQDMVESIAASGVQVVVTGGNVSDMALHFLDRQKLICLRVASKWELRRLSQAVGATALVRLGPPTPDEMGYCDTVSTESIGDRTVTVLQASRSPLSTLVLRASTTSVLNDLERAVDNGVQAVAQACKDGRLVYGGGAVEMALSCKLAQEAERTPGLEQYALAAFGQALQVIPRVLAENAGWNATRVVADLKSAHATSSDNDICDLGIDIERDGGNDSQGGVASMRDRGVVDLLSTKLSAIRLAVDAATTVLKVDQIIMSKQAGGPTPQG